MKRSVLESSNYLKDDCLIIHCTVGIVQTRDEEGKHYVIPVPPSDMTQNLKGLLESGIGSDITFRVGDEFFRAHKSILAARSPVFRAQFFGLVGNPDIETVAIKQIEPLDFKAMLLFLYSDELPEAHELSDSDSACTTTTIMQQLLDVVDRFDLPRLKLMCEAKLCEEITANTVATTLAQAEKHQCLQLKTVCLNFAAKPENLGEVMKSDGYAHLEKSYPSLLTDLLKTSAVTISMSKTNDKILSSKSICETVKDSHEYMIQGFSVAKGIGIGKLMTSRTFTVGGHDWVLLFYPGGISKASKEYVSLYLKILSPGEVRATYEFKLLDQTGKGKHGVHKISSRTFNTATVDKTWGYTKYMKTSELESSSYLKDDCLSIHCTIGIVQTRDETVQTDRVEDEKPFVIPVPPSDMSQNLKGLLESKIGSDITFHVGNESFSAHKSILAARSPVFRAQFFGLVGNPDMETVAIKEFEPFAFKAMLLFLYSDELPEPRELSDSDFLCSSSTLMQHMLDAADRYDLARLKLMCEAKLCEEITADTVATILALAEQYQCLQLKTFCLNFAAKPENLREVMKSDGYAYLEKSFPSLLTDLLTGLCSGKK
ncbi:hypothetical protein MKX03_028009 [Papaver bracteatum]|nr:hypothetical protein MKX03_028009 [Papaver bracteatum]